MRGGVTKIEKKKKKKKKTKSYFPWKQTHYVCKNSRISSFEMPKLVAIKYVKTTPMKTSLFYTYTYDQN